MSIFAETLGVEKGAIIKLDYDPIAIACWMHDNNLKNFTDMYAQAENGHVLPVQKRHNDLAAKIREHYSGKLMMMRMQGLQTTRFRHELFEYLTLPTNSFKYDNIGMIASLPRFFAEDTILEDLKDCFNNSPWEDRESHAKELDIELTYVNSHLKKSFRHHGRIRDEWMCYWCHDENDRLYMIEMDIDCPFRNFWAKTIEHSFTIKGSPIKHEAKDGMRYYTLVDWQIL